MNGLSLGRFFKYLFALVSLFLIFQTGAAAPVYAVEIVYDDFNGGAINQGLWQINDPSGALTQSGGYLRAAGPPNGAYGSLTSKAAWSGDFDIILQYSDFQTTTSVFVTNNPQIALRIIPSSGGGDFLRIYRYYNSQYPERFITDGQLNGISQPVVASANSNSASGQLKISRVGSMVTTYLKEGADWILLGVFANAFTGDIKVQVSTYTGDNGTFQVEADKVLYQPQQNWGQISGKVTKDGTTDPIAGFWVQVYRVYSNSSQWAGNTQTQADGTYTITGLAPGQYKVRVENSAGTDYISEYYDNVLSSSQATPVTVAAGQTAQDINFGLSTGGGRITGKVTKDGTTDPIAGLWVQANFFNSNEWASNAQTQADGTYTITGLSPGQYRVQVSTSGTDYVSEYYDNVLSSSQATPVNVVAGLTTQNINFGLATGGKISGVVTSNATGQPIAGLWVNASYFSSGNWAGNRQTQADGTYTITGLSPGQYRVQVSTSGTDYVSEYYDNVLSSSQATPVNVVAGLTTQNINFGLATGATISGTVYQSNGVTPLTGKNIWVTPWIGSCGNRMGIGSANVNSATGTYTIPGLSAGSYYLQASSSDNYISEWWASPQSVRDCAGSPLIVVTEGQVVPGKDFQLDPGATISGTVYQSDGVTPLTGKNISIRIYTGSPCGSRTQVGSATVNSATGTYSTSGLPAGTYYLQTSSSDNYVSEWWASPQSVRDCAGAQSIVVTGEQVVIGKNFQLDPGATISGTVYQSDGVTPLTGNNIWIPIRTGSPCGSYTTVGNAYVNSANGTYTTPGLPAGTYYLQTHCFDNKYIFEWWASPQSVRDCAGAQSIVVTERQVVTGKNFQLDLAGLITGRVTREADGTPLQGIEINLTDFATGAGRTTEYTGADGTYRFAIVPGNYRILAAASAYDYEYYNNTTTYGAATSVAVIAGQTTANIDFALALGGVDDGTVSFAGTVLEMNGTVIGQATVEVVGSNPSITTTTDANGAYTIPGLPAGNPFVLKFSKAGYLPTYSVVLISGTNLQLSPYYLVAQRGDVNAVWTSQGAIWGRVDNRNDMYNQFVEGATVVATSATFPGTTYPVYYCDDSGACRTDQGTYSKGYFLIPNAPDDTVIVQAFKDGWSFDPRTYRIFADGICMTYIHGIPTPSDLTFAGYVKDNLNAVLPGVAAQMVGNNVVTATTDGTGLYNVAGLPNNAGFYVGLSKAGYIPVYMANISSTAPINNSLAFANVLYPNGQFPISTGKSAIQGKVINPSTGATVSGAVVTLHSANSPSGNNYVVNYCNDSGACSSAQSGTYSNGNFVVYNVDAGEAIVVRATKNGWDFSDRTLVTFADAISQVIVKSSMAITPYVENQHTADGNYYTFLSVPIDNTFTGSLPDSISEITVTGPNGNVIATKPDFIYYPEFREFIKTLPGQPTLGDYHFTVTGNGMTVTGADVQIINRNLPVPDKNGFTYTLGYTPTFFWPALNYTECPLYYRLIINDMSGSRVYSSNRVLGMLSHTVPTGILQMGQAYQFHVRVSDSSSGQATQNSSRSGWVTFTMPMLQTILFSGTLQNKNGTVIGQAMVEALGTNLATTTDASGSFTLSGIPAGNPFVLKFSKVGYKPTYSAALIGTSDMQGSTFTLYATRGEVNALWTSQGAIWGRVDNRNDNSQNVIGATVVATSAYFPGTTYPVYYCDDSGNCRTDLGTYGNGRFLIANAPEDTVIVQAFKGGWSFDPRVFPIFTDGVAMAQVHGIDTPSNVSFTGYVKDNANAGLPGAAIQMVGNDAVTATTDGSGYFNVVDGLPNNAGFYMRFSKTGYIPVYSAVISATGSVSTPSMGAFVLYPTNNQFITVAAGKSAIIGKVLDGETGAPVGGAVVTLATPGSNDYVVNYCTDAGVCSPSPSGTNSNGMFVVFNVHAGDAIVVRAEKSGWGYYDRFLVTFADAITETILRGGWQGDLNGDGTVGLADVILALKVMAGMNPDGIRTNYATSGVDIDGDGRIGVAEVIYILQKMAGIR